MLKKLTLIIIIVASVFSSRADDDNIKLLKKLDVLIDNREQYTQKKQDRITWLAELYGKAESYQEKYLAAVRLFEENLTFDIDSAMYYARIAVIQSKKLNLEKQIESKFCLIHSYILSGMYYEAFHELNLIEKELYSDSLKSRYYLLKATMYRYMKSYVSDISISEKYGMLASTYQDSLLQISERLNLDFPTIRAERMKDQGKIEEGIKLLENEFDKYEPEDRMYAYITYTLAELYESSGNKEKQIESLILSAKSDLYGSVKENIALRELAVLLFESGQIDRSYKYIKIALDDALFSKARLRSYEILFVLPIIDNAYKEMKSRKQKFKTSLIWSVSILSVFLIILLLFFYRQKNALKLVHQQVKLKNGELNESKHQLEKSHKQLLILNNQLSKENQLQEEHITKYLKLSYSYICKINNYRTSLYNKANKVPKEELIRILKSDEFIENELREFYVDFDKAFLALHPEFVSKLNLLLRDEEQYHLKDGELLNSELRIFALIRLGITDSNQIADFLRYSLTTIYNYRTKVRNKARILRDEFENEVMKL